MMTEKKKEEKRSIIEYWWVGFFVMIVCFIIISTWANLTREKMELDYLSSLTPEEREAIRQEAIGEETQKQEDLEKYNKEYLEGMNQASKWFWKYPINWIFLITFVGIVIVVPTIMRIGRY